MAEKRKDSKGRVLRKGEHERTDKIPLFISGCFWKKMLCICERFIVIA